MAGKGDKPREFQPEFKELHDLGWDYFEGKITLEEYNQRKELFWENYKHVNKKRNQ